MMADKFKIYALAENTLTVQMEPIISKKQIRALQGLRSQILAHKQAGIIQVIVTFHELSIFYDSTNLTFEVLRDLVRKCLSSTEEDNYQRTEVNQFTVPVCYDEDKAWDKARLESHTRLSFDEIVRLHSRTVYTFYMMGFLPGFLYMGGLDETLACPRLEEPRLKVLRGSIGIAGQQTGIYPMDSPGGWNIIGRTPLIVFDFHGADKNNNQQIIHPLDEVIFTPVSQKKYQQLRGLTLLEYQQTIKTV